MIDLQGATKPNFPRREPAAETQPVRRRARRHRWRWILHLALLVVFLAVLVMLPLGPRTNVLLLGADRSLAGSSAARTDTVILMTVQPWQRYVGLLSIPRDLWLPLPQGRVNRINTAYYFAELAVPGSGLAAAKETVATNFGVDVDHGLVIHLEGVVDLIDALGGVPVNLEEPRGGLPAGRHVLDGETALAFVRDRAGSDDFGRMANGQFFLRAALLRLVSPATIPRLPQILAALPGLIETDVPPWRWPGLALAVLFVGPGNLDSRVVDRTMAVGMVTAEGAQVLRPNWDAINPVLLEMFGQ